MGGHLDKTKEHWRPVLAARAGSTGPVHTETKEHQAGSLGRWPRWAHTESIGWCMLKSENTRWDRVCTHREYWVRLGWGAPRALGGIVPKEKSTKWAWVGIRREH